MYEGLADVPLSGGADTSDPTLSNAPERAVAADMHEDDNHEDAAGAVNGELEDTADGVDSADADILETLLQEFNPDANAEQDHSAAPPSPDQMQSAGPQPSNLEPPPPVLGPSSSDEPSVCAVIVDRFPLGSPGAPIPGAHQGSHVYQRSRDTFGSSEWAPFCSQRDWEVAHWAKMRGPTSSALAELLAIPEVCGHFFSVYLLINDIERWPMISGYHIAHQEN